MSYFHCGNGHPDDCNGYRGPLDTYVCPNSRHQEPAVYVCSQESHPGAEFYGSGGCAECGYKP